MPTATKKSHKNILSTWQQVKLASIFDFKNGLNKEKKFFGQWTPIINYMDVNNGWWLYQNNIIGRVEVNASELERFEVKKGDVFFTRTSETLDEIWFSAVALDDFKDTVFSGFILRARPRNDLLLPSYAKYCFRTQKARQEIKEKSSYTTRALTSGSLLNHVNLSLPPLPEQNRIVAVLETWDRAIETLTKKIEIKKQIKKGLMQELLTGKTRLKGFSGKWKKIALSDIGNFLKWMGILKDQVTESGFNAVRYGELYTKYDVKIERIFSHIPASVIPSAQKIQYGDILFAGSGETIDEIGKSASYLIREDWYAGGDIIIFRPQRADSLFLWYFFNTGEARKKLRELWQGQAVVHLYKSDIEDLSFQLPTQEEQVAIASILNSADKEITTLEKKLTLLNDQKKYLLNNLITGEIRTPENLTI